MDAQSTAQKQEWTLHCATATLAQSIACVCLASSSHEATISWRQAYTVHSKMRNVLLSMDKGSPQLLDETDLGQLLQDMETICQCLVHDQRCAARMHLASCHACLASLITSTDDDLVVSLVLQPLFVALEDAMTHAWLLHIATLFVNVKMDRCAELLGFSSPQECHQFLVSSVPDWKIEEKDSVMIVSPSSSSSTMMMRGETQQQPQKIELLTKTITQFERECL